MVRTPKDIIAEARKQIREVPVKEAKKLMAKGAVAIDVRERHEIDLGHIPGAMHIPRGLLEYKVAGDAATEDPDATIICYCGGGGRGALATKTLLDMGYTNAMSLAGGYDAWVQAGEPVQLPGGLEEDEDE